MPFDAPSLEDAWSVILDRLQEIYGTSGFYQLGNPQGGSGTQAAGAVAPFPHDCEVEPFQVVRVFDNCRTTPSHWHYVTLGLSDLFARYENIEREAASGFGFELTMRVPRELRPVGELQPRGLIRLYSSA